MIEQRDPVEVLGEEFIHRHRNGEAVSIDQYADAHPQWSNEIRRLFRTMVAMEKFKSSSLSSSEPSMLFEVEGLEQLGDFRIIGEIGRGAMGIVYEAEQQSLRRPVAVKVFPRKMLSDSRQLQRFQREAQTAAGLHHTNIVPVFGVGQDDGLHYFVMQRIVGISLDQSDQDKSNERLMSEFVADVGEQVCDAVGFAHDQGVLHRDIKPSNLLLDSRGTIWVTDFGLATVMETELSGGQHDVAGTPRFMAPENFGGKTDTRSDVYSLGLTLYELLTGRSAFSEGSRSALIQQICSGRFRRPREIRPAISRDLEAVILKATRVDPADRYPSLHEMAADLRRFREGRPVHARRISPVSRFGRWTRRSPLISSLVGALLMGAVSSFMLISMKWRDAVAESDRAEANLSLALESMEQILERFGSSWMAQPAIHDIVVESISPGMELQIEVSDHSVAVLEDALKFYDRFAQQNSSNVAVRRETAKVHRRVGDIYDRLGKFGKAEEAYKRSLAVLDTENKSSDLDADLALQRGTTLHQMGRTKNWRSRFNEAKSFLLRAERSLSDSRWNQQPAFQAELARIHDTLGQTLRFLGDREGAHRHQELAVEILEKVSQQYPEQAAYRLALARAFRNHRDERGSEDRNRDRMRESGVVILEDLVHDFPGVPDYKCELAEMLLAFSSRGSSRNDGGQHLDRMTDAVAITRELVREHPSIPRYRVVHARSLRELAKVQRDTDTPSADENLADSVEVYRSLVEEFADVPVYSLFLAFALKEQGEGFIQSQEWEKAAADFEEAIVAQRVYCKLRPESPMGNDFLMRLERELERVQESVEGENSVAGSVGSGQRS